jgi:hypothetical protein
MALKIEDIHMFVLPEPICNPWCWYIYLHSGDFVRANVAEYRSTMEHMGKAGALLDLFF